MAVFYVRPFDAINQRAALQGDFARVVRDLVVGQNPAHGHGQVEFDHVAAIPCALQSSHSPCPVRSARYCRLLLS